jgi:hypothetical protein
MQVNFKGKREEMNDYTLIEVIMEELYYNQPNLKQEYSTKLRAAGITNLNNAYAMYVEGELDKVTSLPRPLILELKLVLKQSKFPSRINRVESNPNQNCRQEKKWSISRLWASSLLAKSPLKSSPESSRLTQLGKNPLPLHPSPSPKEDSYTYSATNTTRIRSSRRISEEQ